MTRIRRGIITIAVAMAITAASTPGAGAAVGTRLIPDQSFGSGRGWVATAVPGWSAAGAVAVSLHGGRTVVAAQVFRGSESQIAVVRYLRNGRVDRSFGTGGVFRTDFPAAAGPILASGIGVQPGTGRVVISGGYGQGSVLALRLRTDGSLDRTFGSGRGFVTTAVGGVGEALALGNGGGILVGASNANANGRPMVVVRYTPDGRLDRSFGRDGVVSRMFWNPKMTSSAGVTGLVIGTGGTVTAATHLDAIGGDGHGSAGVFRVDANGRTVRSFGDNGTTEVAFRSAAGTLAQWFPCAMVPSDGGRLIVTGSGTMPGRSGSLLTVRLTSGGRVDRSFGTQRNGRVVTTGVTDGNITTCGAAPGPGGGIRVGIGRWLIGLDTTGRPERALSRDGTLRVRPPNGVSLGSVPLSRAGKLVAAGVAKADLLVTRYRTARGLG